MFPNGHAGSLGGPSRVKEGTHPTDPLPSGALLGRVFCSDREVCVLDDVLREFRDGYYERAPMLAVNSGLHEYDGLLPDFSTTAVAERLTWLEHTRARALSIDGAELTDQQVMLRDYLVVVVDTDLFNLRELRVLENNTWFDYLALDPNLYLARDYAPLGHRMDAYTKHVENLPQALAAMRALVKPMPPGHAEAFQTYLDGLAEFVTSAPYEVFAPVADHGRQSAMRDANDRAAAALGDLARWIESSPRDPDFALGGEKYQAFLWALERLDTPFEELAAMAWQDLELNTRALQDACAAFRPGATVQQCRDQVAARKPADGPVDAARRQLELLRSLVVEREIVTVPDMEVVVAESPPHQRSGTAYISVAGPYEPDQPSYYYISPPDPTWSHEHRLAYTQSEADLMTTSTHCVWTGHILEAMLCHRPGNALAEFTYSYAFCEGWCAYSEEMMLHEALDDDPELTIGQLQNALLGDVRVLVSIGLHTGGMTLDQAERLFRERAFCDSENARMEAIRGSFDPGYLFYAVGKWMVTKLRDDWMALHPDRSLRDFHDAFLSHGDAPIALLRRLLLGDGDDGRLLAAPS